MATASRGQGADAPSLRPTEPAAPPTLVVDDGAGSMLGLAMGDVAAQGHRYGYRTQSATVVAYHLMEHGRIVVDALRSSWLELWGPDGGVYTEPVPEFEAMLRAASFGTSAVSAVPSTHPMPWMAPIGVWFRNDPDGLIGSAAELVGMGLTDAASTVAAAAVAGAVAAGAIAMSGWDFVLSTAESADRAEAALRPESTNPSAATAVSAALRRVSRMVGSDATSLAEAMPDVDPVLRGPLVAIASAADTAAAPPLVIEAMAQTHGADAAVVAGSILGARLGLRRWPWRVPNETWFAEIGLRLVRHEREYLDLPIPRVVEERVRSSDQVDPAREID